MDNPLSKLKIDYWYHAVMVVSIVILILALTVKLEGINNTTVQLYSLGSFLIGLGEWKNHPLQTKIHTPNEYMPTGGIITGYPRSNNFLGVLFVVLGTTIIFFGIFS